MAYVLQAAVHIDLKITNLKKATALFINLRKGLKDLTESFRLCDDAAFRRTLCSILGSTSLNSLGDFMQTFFFFSDFPFFIEELGIDAKFDSSFVTADVENKLSGLNSYS